jgi:hypothetical protein
MAAEIDKMLAELPSLSPDEMLRLREAIDRRMAQFPSKSAASGSQQLQALNHLRQELSALPVHNPNDGLSNRDHDRIVYGGDP